MKITIAHVMGKMNGGGVESVVMNYYQHINHDKFQFDFICDKDSKYIPYDEINKLGTTIVMVTHDVRTAMRGNRVIFISDGAVVGEYKMPLYSKDDMTSRKDGLQNFLDRMGW